MSQPAVAFPDIEASLKRVAAALREADVDFVLGGSIAAWARGAPESCNDIDLALRPADVEPALAALDAAGLRTERPPEGWLVKAHDGPVLIDLIFDPNGIDDLEAVFVRAEEQRVAATPIKVMAIEDVLVAKLCSFDEHYLDFTRVLAIARALREQIDWDEVRRRTAPSPYAAAFLYLLEALEVVSAPQA
ncbi:MAG: nucleotidyltransferase family protein [Actinomycetota bacterium]|nr:nucleotidyltransferase family protein [Actinomycetota bacterium]